MFAKNLTQNSIINIAKEWEHPNFWEMQYYISIPWAIIVFDNKKMKCICMNLEYIMLCKRIVTEKHMSHEFIDMKCLE